MIPSPWGRRILHSSHNGNQTRIFMCKRTRIFQRLFIIGIIIYLAVSGLLLFVSRQNWFLAGGSDSLAVIYRPYIVWQCAVLICIPALVYAVVRDAKTGNRIRRKMCQIGLLSIAVMFFFLSFNYVTINGRTGTVTQTWAIVHYNKLVFGGSNFPDGRIQVTGLSPFITLTNDAGESQLFFLGIPPLYLDKKMICNHPLIHQCDTLN